MCHSLDARDRINPSENLVPYQKKLPVASYLSMLFWGGVGGTDMNGEKRRDRQTNTSEHQKCEPKEKKSFVSGGMISYTFFPHIILYILSLL